MPIPDRFVDICRLFYTSELLQLIRDESNRYAEQVMDSTKQEKWNPITVVYVVGVADDVPVPVSAYPVSYDGMVVSKVFGPVIRD